MSKSMSHTRANAKSRYSVDFCDGMVRLWLIVVAVLVYAMVVVGGATRLTDSGLSITEWLPILGAMPPLSDADWQVAFVKYQQIPEYHLVNHGMSLAEFQFIYWWEWSHRFLGRFIGVAFAIPFLAFWLSGMLRDGLAPKLLGVLALGGLQGFFGWYMVKSGLVDRIDVSHYRLALHLFTAFLILALLVWLIASLTKPSHLGREKISSSQSKTAWAIVGLIFLQVLLGAFVAGTKAGLGYNTWPLMDGEFIPSGLFDTAMAWYVNPFENVIQIQFNHRMVAYIVLALGLWHAISLWCTDTTTHLKTTAIVLALALVTQAAVGIATLLAVPKAGGIPIGLGLAHQGGGALVTALATWHLYWMMRARTPETG